MPPAQGGPEVAPTASVEVKDVTKSFGSQPVLQGVSLQVFPGRVYGLVGENGSGKSTLIKILSGYHWPTGGEVLSHGQVVPAGSPSASHAAGLRFVHQNQGLVPEMNAVENLGLGVGYAHPQWVRWRQEAATARELLAQLDVDMDVNKPLSEARAVERTAVAIARAIRHRPGDEIHMLVLDEPTAALPPHEVGILFNIIRQSCRQGMAVLYVSHRLDEVEEITDEVAVLRDGVLVGHDNLRTLGREKLIAMMLGGEREVPAVAKNSMDVVDRNAAPVLQVSELHSDRLHGIEFDAAPGEIVGIAGIDGSGREDLARALVGAVEARGAVRIAGNLVDPLTPARAAAAGLALVPAITEPGSTVDEFNVRENLTLATLPSTNTWRGVSRSKENAIVREWISRVDIRPPDPNKAFPLLSGGNKQKVIIAKWLALGSPAYILNEPTAGVDVGARRRIHEFVLAQAAKGITFVVCSSDLEDLDVLCRRVLVLREGKVVADLRGKDVNRANLLRDMSGQQSGRVTEHAT